MLSILTFYILQNLSFLTEFTENIAFNRPAWQENPFNILIWGAELAVDGRYSDLSNVGGQCVISEVGMAGRPEKSSQYTLHLYTVQDGECPME